MERYKVILAYDGTEFHGSQYQTDTRTVQNVVEVALRKLNWSGDSLFFAGRTDAGVHASGQVIAFDLDWNHSPLDLRNALNALLPKDVAAKDVCIASPDFHPRFDAVERTYNYRIYCKPVREPNLERFAWRVWPHPDHRCLPSLSEKFVGIHDFSGFGRATRQGGSTIREVFSADWTYDNGKLSFLISGNAFLYHMVRRMVYLQVLVSQGKLDISKFEGYLSDPDSGLGQGLAPPQGLSLVEVSYPEDINENKVTNE
jgi:tRNA pseudouridine38-40 synthase